MSRCDNTQSRESIMRSKFVLKSLLEYTAPSVPEQFSQPKFPVSWTIRLIFINMPSFPCPDDTPKVQRRMLLTCPRKNWPTTDKPAPPNLSFLKQFHSEDSVSRVPIAPHSQSTPNESNSACWNGLHPLPPAFFTNKSFRFRKQSGWFYNYIISHPS